MSHLVDWRSKIQKAGTDGEIGHDVTFKVIESGVFSNEKELGTEATVGAHKFVLCLVSEVFTKMFNGNLSEGATVTIEGCAITPFVTVIKSLYMPNNHLGKVEDVYHLLEMFNVVERYDISSLRVVILKLLQNLRVKTTNMTDILNAMTVGACFEEPLKILKSIVQNFLASQGSVLNLVDMIIPFSHDDIKVHLVKNLVKTGHKYPVKTFKALRDIEKSMDAPNAIDTKTSSEVIHSCLRGLEDIMGTKKMCEIVPDTANDATIFVALFQLWKINWCSNCSSASCKHGGMLEKIDEVRGEVRVRGRNDDFTGTISAINVIQTAAKVAEGKKQRCAVCVLKNDLAAMNICDGTEHQLSEITAGVVVQKSNGDKIFKKYGDLVYNCKK